MKPHTKSFKKHFKTQQTFKNKHQKTHVYNKKLKNTKHFF